MKPHALAATLLLPLLPMSTTAMVLEHVESKIHVQDAMDGLNGASWTTVSPDGKHVYVSGKTDAEIGVFGRDPLLGSVTPIEVETDAIPGGGSKGLFGVQGLAVSPDGFNLYNAGSTNDSIGAYDRDPATGMLTYIEKYQHVQGGLPLLDGAWAVRVSPDNAHVYAAAANSNTVTVFERDAGDGTLSLLQTVEDVDPVTGLFRARALAFSSDGADLYVGSLGPGTSGGSVVVFERNSETGLLTFTESHRDGVAGVAGIGSTRAVVVSPDDRFVYATGGRSNAIATFSRDPATGMLTWLEAIYDTDPGVAGLNEPDGMAMDPSGRWIFVAGRRGETLAAFERDLVTGALTFADVMDKFDLPDQELRSPPAVSISPGGEHLYVAAEGPAGGGALVIFAPEPNAALGAGVCALALAALRKRRAIAG